MFWTLGWLWLLWALGVISGAAIIVFTTAKSGRWALSGLGFAIAAIGGALYLIMQWLGPAGGA